MKERGRLFLRQNFVKAGCLIFAYVLRHIFYFAAENAVTEVNLNYVTDLKIVAGFYNAGVYQNVLVTASVIGYGSSFNNAGYL